MAEKLPLYTDLPAQRYSVALEGVQYEIRLVYRARTASWYLDLADENGTWLLRGRRLSPGSSPQAGMIVGGPPGAIVPVASDPYDRHEIELWYATAEDVAAAAAEDEEDGDLPLVFT